MNLSNLAPGSDRQTWKTRKNRKTPRKILEKCARRSGKPGNPIRGQCQVASQSQTNLENQENQENAKTNFGKVCQEIRKARESNQRAEPGNQPIADNFRTAHLSPPGYII